jgi:hypothetical protein
MGLNVSVPTLTGSGLRFSLISSPLVSIGMVSIGTVSVSCANKDDTLIKDNNRQILKLFIPTKKNKKLTY